MEANINEDNEAPMLPPPAQANANLVPQNDDFDILHTWFKLTPAEIEELRVGNTKNSLRRMKKHMCLFAICVLFILSILVFVLLPNVAA